MDPNISPQLEPLTVPLDNIELLKGNPRQGNVQAVAKSYETFGQLKPIVVRRTGENEHGPIGTVIAGNHQLQAARQLGWDRIAAVFVEHDDGTAKAYALADNRTAELGGYDKEALAALIQQVQAETELLAATGWTEGDLAEILAETHKPDPKITDQVPEPPIKVVSKPGDVWELGRHRLICGDSTDAKTYDKLMKKEKADMLLTDPPWNVNIGEKDSKGRGILNDHMNKSDWETFVHGFTTRFKERTKPGAPAYVVMGANEWPSVDRAMRAAGFHWSATIIWVKDRLVLGRRDYHSQYEPIWNGHNGPMDPIWYGWNDNAARLAAVLDRTQSDVWLVDRPTKSELHPTTKPIELLTRAIENSVKYGGMVLDPFGGSGSTLMACEATGRTCRTIELDPKYCDIIARRWQEATGNLPKLNGTELDLTPNFGEGDEVPRPDQTE